MDVSRDTLQEKLTEAVLSDEITPSASRRINSLLLELNQENPTQERINDMDRECDSVMSNLTGETVDELVQGMHHPVQFGLFRLVFTLAILFFGGRGIFRAVQGEATLIDILLAGVLLFTIEEYFRARRKARLREN